MQTLSWTGMTCLGTGTKQMETGTKEMEEESARLEQERDEPENSCTKPNFASPFCEPIHLLRCRPWFWPCFCSGSGHDFGLDFGLGLTHSICVCVSGPILHPHSHAHTEGVVINWSNIYVYGEELYGHRAPTTGTMRTR
jgi:hypothetical protein